MKRHYNQYFCSSSSSSSRFDICLSIGPTDWPVANEQQWKPPCHCRLLSSFCLTWFLIGRSSFMDNAYHSCSVRTFTECYNTRMCVLNLYTSIVWLGGVAVGCWTCCQSVTGSNPCRPAVECKPGQIVNAHVPLSPSSIIWCQPMGGDALRLGW